MPDSPSDRGIEGVLGDYRPLLEISRGPGHVVYKAHQKSVDRVVALKVFEGGAAGKARLTAAPLPDHAAFVPIYDVGEAGGRPYIAMGFVEGRSLRARIEGEGPFPAREAANLMKQVAEAIHFAHGRGIAHRRLSPETVLINARNRPRILPGDAGPAVGEADGTAADVSAVGALFHFAMTGQSPPPEAPARGDGGTPGVPDGLGTVVRQCLCPAPGPRYARADEVADDLARWLRGEPVVPKPDIAGDLRRLRDRARSPRVVRILLASSAVVIASAIFAIWLGRSRKDPSKVEAAASADGTDTPAAVEAHAARGRAGTALVEVELASGRRSIGAAFCIDQPGMFATAARVIRPLPGDKPLKITLTIRPGRDDQESAQARAIREDYDEDLALLRADREVGAAPLEIAEGRPPEGAEISAFGYPFGKATGDGKAAGAAMIEARMGRDEAAGGGRADGFRIESPLPPGYEGGPAMDRGGRVVGMISARPAVGGNLARLAIPAGHLSRFLTRPEIGFDPPAIVLDDPESPIEWAIEMAPGPGLRAAGTDDVQVVLRIAEAGAEDLVVPARASGDRSFSARFYLPEGLLDPKSKAVQATVEAKQGGEILARAARRIPINRPTQPAPAPTPAAPPPAEVTQAVHPFPDGWDVLELPGKIDEAVPAGGGRHLLLLRKKDRELLVYEVATNRISRTLPLLSPDVLVAGSEGKFVLVYRDLNLIQRFDLGTFEADLERKLPDDRASQAIVLGAGSAGPLLWAWTPMPTSKLAAAAEARQYLWLSLVDLDTLKEITLQSIEATEAANPQGRKALRNIGAFQAFLPGRDDGRGLRARASSGGDFFVIENGWSGPNLLSTRKKGKALAAKLTKPPQGGGISMIPSPDGRSALASPGGMVDADGTSISPPGATDRKAILLPVADPAITPALSIDRSGKPILAFLLPDGRELLSIDASRMADRGRTWNLSYQDGFPTDRRIAFDPPSGRVAVIPPGEGRIISLQPAIDEAFEKLGGPVLTSSVILWASAGQEFRECLRARSPRGKVTFRLQGSLAPAGLQLSPDGQVTWKVPVSWLGKEGSFVAALRDDDGQESTALIKILAR